MKQVTVFLVLISCLFSIIVKSQTAEIDSLQNLLLQHMQRDSVRVNLLNKSAGLLQNINADKTMKYIVEAGEIAGAIDYKKGMADTWDQMAASYYIASNFAKVLEYANRSLLINEAIDNKKGLAKNLHDIGKIYYFKGDVDKAMEYMSRSLEINKGIKDSAAMCYNYASLGTNYSDIGNYTLALMCTQKAADMAYEINDEKAISYAMNNLGVVYELQGKLPQALECYQKSFFIDEHQKNYKDASIVASNIALILKMKGNYANALEFSEKGVYYARQIGFKTGLTYNYENLGHIYKEQGNYNKAWEYQQKTLLLQQEIGNQQAISIAYRDIAELYVLQKDFIKGKEYYKRALDLSKSISYKRIEVSSYIGLSTIYLLQQNYKEAQEFSNKAYAMAVAIGNLKLVKQSSEILAKSCEGMGMYPEAYKAYSVFKAVSDSLFNEEKIKKMANLEYEYKFEKEKELLELEQQKRDKLQLAELKKQRAVIEVFYLVFFLMILLALVILRSYRQNKKANYLLQQKNKEIESTAEQLKSTNEELLSLSQFKEDMTNMVIHDLKNPLSAILNIEILPEGKKRQEIIKQSGLKMMNLVENILDVYKYKSTEIVLSKEKIDLIDVINTVTQEIDFLAQLKEIEFNIEICGGIEAYADSIVLKRVFANILSNALKFSYSQKTISIYCNILEDSSAKIAIRNFGPHIPIENQEQIFEKFGQAEKKAQGKLNSTGLGLTYCKLAINAHGGAIGVDSVENGPTTFWFTLPHVKVIA